ncbi:hypothetical protein P3L10_029113 [Capsicum annuum]
MFSPRLHVMLIKTLPKLKNHIEISKHFPMDDNNTPKSNGQMSVQEAQVAVVMVPLPAQGHLNQLLHLSRIITSYDIPVHYVGATTHIRQAKFRVHVQDVPTIPNAECYRFNSISAFHTFSCIWEARGKPFQAETEIFEDIPSIEGKICSGELYNSSRAIEGLYLDLVAKEVNGFNLWAIGPFNPLLLTEQKKDSNKHHQIFDWLDRQEKNSVIYVSFGTTTSLSDKQIEELTIGLEKSMQKFIWVLRDADKGDVFAGEERRAQLPEGYEVRLKGRGVIVRDWAPQLEILAHPSTGGFMSHCGWNSCMESISMGVPIAAWPMHSYQPRNSQLITKVLKIGLNVRHWAHQDELVTSEIIENAVRTLMASPEGDEMRKRAAELSIAVKQSVLDGGGNSVEMDST